MTEHTLKTHGTVWEAIKSGQKRFEVRRNDRFFQQGDVVVLRKMGESGRYYERDYSSDDKFATFDLRFKIGWMLHGGQFGIEPGYVVFQLENVDA